MSFEEWRQDQNEKRLWKKPYYDMAREAWGHQQKTIDQLKKEIELLEKSNDFYGDKSNWRENEYYRTSISTKDWTSLGPISAIGGRLARECQQELRKMRSRE